MNHIDWWKAYGSRTGQHQQGTQQAELLAHPWECGEGCEWCAAELEAYRARPTRIDAYLGCDHPPCEDWLRDVIDMAFVHADRIEIETWSFPAEDPVITRAERAAGFWDDLTERGAQEEK